MRLLVSVRDAAEAARAVAGGADIVDAKDPARGALGPVSAQALAAIRQAVPPGVPLSAALGDVATAAQVRRALEPVHVELAFVKFGFGGVSGGALIQRLLREAVSVASRLPGRPAVIAVAYADWQSVGSLAPEAYPALIQAAGAHGLLLDTAGKTRALPALVAADELRALGVELTARGLAYALGGSLAAQDLPLAQAAGAGIVGVRGAACAGGRNGMVELEKVRALARAVAAEGPAASRVGLA